MTDELRCLAALALVLLISCNETDKKAKGKGEQSGTSTKDSPSIQPASVQPQSAPQKGEYCYIARVYEEEGVNYIDADYIQFLMGDKAVAAAKKEGDAMYDIDKKGDTSYYVPNDYYVVNENSRIRKLTLAANFTYEPVEIGGETVDMKASVLSVLKKRMKDRIFILTVKDNVVSRIKEQYVP